jgi:putative endonuclease
MHASVSRETFNMKQSDKQGPRNQIGAYGERIVAQYLSERGWRILATNYLKKWGEIDLVARETNRNGSIIHFVEVKTVSYETKTQLQAAISRGTWRPEENVHEAKLRRLQRAIESWLLENNCTTEWVIDVAAVRVVPREKYATVKYIENVIL